MDDDSLVLQTQACSLAEVKFGYGASEKTGFLRLPPELRQKVYRELLGPRNFGNFQTSILRVSKEIHDEAAELFYGENGFVMYHLHRKVIGQLRPPTRDDSHDFPSSFALYLLPVTGADVKIGSEPALTVSIALQHSCSSVAEFETYVGSPNSLTGLCKVLTCCPIRTSLHLRLSLPSMKYRKLEGRLDRLLDIFQECRGVGTAEILAAGGLPVETDLSSLMGRPFEHFDEILTRARCYQDRVCQLAALRPVEVLPTLERAYYFLDWWASRGFELSNETDQKWTEFWDMRLDTSLAYAFRWLQYGKPGKAREVIRYMLKTQPLKLGSAPVPRRFWEKESEGHYIEGLCFLFEGNRISALYSFLQALISKPGHEGGDKEIDNMEAAIENSDYPPDEIVRWNIKHVLERFRHQPVLDPSLDADNHSHRGPAGMTADEMYRLVDNFAHLAICRLQRLDRR